MEIRSLFADEARYATFNREERNCVAMLYHALLAGGNLDTFLAKTGWDGHVDWDAYEIAVEWSYLRDLWSRTTDQILRRRIIERGLDQNEGHGGGSATSIESFNAFYGARPKASAKFVQSPATWHLPDLAKRLTDNNDFLAACKLKWAFRIKPDLVVTHGQSVMCVEAKYESGESSYPTTTKERQFFSARGLPPVSQTELQRFLITDLLGLKGKFVFLTLQPVGATATADTTNLTWSQAFDGLDLTGSPSFIRDWVQALPAQ